MTTLRTLLMTLAVGLLAVGCGGDSKEAGGTGEGGGSTAAAASVPLPDGLFVEAAPEGAINVDEAKESAKEGDEIAVRGRIGGVLEPFTKGRAAMTLADMDNIVSCADMEEDHCPTPWDYCCESPEELIANTLTVQVVGDDGRPLKSALDGAHGIEPLSVVVVKGKVGPRPGPGVLILNASAIYVEK
jgi:hypothetical protein